MYRSYFAPGYLDPTGKCLFVIDGTWSRDFNFEGRGSDASGIPVGSTQNPGDRSNSRRFYEESGYPDGKKHYFGGPQLGVTGLDSGSIKAAVRKAIDEALCAGQCEHIDIVGWSRGAAIATEIAEEMSGEEYCCEWVERESRRQFMDGDELCCVASRPYPNIRFLGLFDSVAMIPPYFGWGEEVPATVDNLAHALAEDRAPIFPPRNPDVQSPNNDTATIPGSNHGTSGGFDSSGPAQAAYNHVRDVATRAGVP
jgi:hypothetical protein